jgi:predicted enzyme related to lactoylglutathione lyase
MKLRNRIISVSIWSDNYEKLATWYEEVLGFEVRERLTLPDDTGVDFQFGDAYFYIGKHDKVKGVSHDPYRIMVHFNVDSVSDVYKELLEKNVTVIAPPFVGPPGGFWCMTIADPEGNILQFFGQK